MARTVRRTRKKRSGWIHPLDLNRNRRRCAKRRRSASVDCRLAVLHVRSREVELELAEARTDYLSRRPERRPDRGRPDRRPARGLEPRSAW